MLRRLYDCRQLPGWVHEQWWQRCASACSLQQSRRGQAQDAPDSTREKRRVQPGAETATGTQTTLIEPPDFTSDVHFNANTLEHVSVPELSLEHRSRSDVERDEEMRRRYGIEGPGERPTKGAPNVRRDMLQEQQDIDGLPWEVRWRRSLIPTPEEALQDIRDRIDLFVQDPIEREQEWYLHWKDRLFRAQKDRMIWPQGFTDYLDHYDQYGRRRVLPSDQRWSDSSWKHLADVHYKDRLWLLEGEERTALNQSLQPQTKLLTEEERRVMDVGDVVQGMVSGVIDMRPNQVYEAVTGSADPRQVAATKQKLRAYGALQFMQSTSKEKPTTSEATAATTTPTPALDPVTRMPKAEMEPLPTGITVEQASLLVAQANVEDQKHAQLAASVRELGQEPMLHDLRRQLELSKAHGDRPILSSQIEQKVALLRQANQTVQGQMTVKFASAAKAIPTARAASDKPEGFINVAPHTVNTKPTDSPELYYTPPATELATMPAWYHDTLVQTDPLIKPYSLVHDPLEEGQQESTSGKSTATDYYTPPPWRETRRIDLDDAPNGESVFDAGRMMRVKYTPELAEGFKPLPLYREAIQQQARSGESAGDTADKQMTTAERVRRERIARMRQRKLQCDPDILLPRLPWETDSVADPYRGVAGKDLIAVDRAALERTWRAYRDAFRQTISEFVSLSGVTAQESGVHFLLEAAARFRDGVITGTDRSGAVAPEQEAVFRTVFEGHTKQYLSDYLRDVCRRVSDAQVYKIEADALLRRASAKAKMLGSSFMNFVQEMATYEVDLVRQRPIQRHAIILHERRHEPLVRPVVEWLKRQLPSFLQTEFTSPEQLRLHHGDLLRHLRTARASCPTQVADVNQAVRDALVESIYCWASGLVNYYAATHLQQMFINYAETRFRDQAESMFEDANEWFVNAEKIGHALLFAPVPNAEPFYEYTESDFLEGENAVLAECSGRLERAEEIWHSGSTKRWYPVFDETEYMWFNERRGHLQIATAVSDRCLENLIKRTHPSIHPFPTRARPYLEGAPLTQETAEHLWLRYIGDVYWEHATFMLRQGRYKTAKEYHRKCLNAYHVAIRAARERLPPTWSAPLLTTAKYTLRAFDADADDARQYLCQVEAVTEQLFALPEPQHWIEPFTTLPFRIALIDGAVPAYGLLIAEETARRLKWQPSQALLSEQLARRARGEGTMKELETYVHTASAVAEEVFRRKILQWRTREKENTDEYFYWTYLYFTFRVYPADRAEVARLWAMYEPAYRYIYTNCALASRSRGQRLITAALRFLCQILLAGDAEQLRVLHTELSQVRERLVDLVDRRELDRTLLSVERHMQDARHPVYIYSTEMLQKMTVLGGRIAENPVTRSQLAAKEYTMLQEREAKLREHNASLSLSEMQHRQASQQLTRNLPDTSSGSTPFAPTARDVLSGGLFTA